MNDDFFEGEFDQAQREQLHQNDARRIRTKIGDAQKRPDLSSVRWPFELLQNAHDAKPRPGRSTITVLFDCRDDQVIFEHDSAPFRARDLAALLSGGSGKEYESEDTTGRFGTGFLSTHVLSARVAISGILQSRKGLGQFALLLERAGDEPSIVRNIEVCNQSIRKAYPVTEIEDLPSARFLYKEPDRTIVMQGIESLLQVLPYLFSTCENLGDVEIRTPDGAVERWTASEPRVHDCAGGFIRERLVEVQGGRTAAYRSLRITARPDASAAALLLAERAGSKWRAVIPQESAPRVFRRFPVRPSDFLQAALVVDAPFDLDQERSHIHLRDRNREHATNRALAREALDAWRYALVFAFQREWLNRHLLARLALSNKSFAGEGGDQGFWREELVDLAKRIALMPLVEVEMEGLCYLRATANGSDSDWADFPHPRLSDASNVVIDVNRFWSVMNDVRVLYPPARGVAHDWSTIAAEWKALDVDVRLVTLETIAKDARGDAKAIADMRLIVDDKLLWIAQFLDLVGECWAKGDGVGAHILNGLLPDQQGLLRAPGELSRDTGIAASLKETAAMIGPDLRSKLLDRQLEAVAAEHKLAHCLEAIGRVVPSSLDEDKVVDFCFGQLDRALVPGKPLPNNGPQLFRGSIHLLDHIWRSKGAEGRVLVFRCPLVASNNYIFRWGGEPATMMAPIRAWHASAQPFAGVYEEARVFHANYHGDAASGVPDVVAALVTWGAAHPDPLVTELPPKVETERLQAIAESPHEAVDVVLSNVQLSQIALIHQLIPRAENNLEHATALLQLVLCYIAPRDEQWRHFDTVKGRKKGALEVDLRVRKAHWIAHLRTRSWVPNAINAGESVKLTAVPASAATLRPFLEKHTHWLKENDAAVTLLSECFDFDQLELRLLGIASDDETRRQIRSGLARLIEVTGAEPGALQALADDIRERQERRARVARSRNIGLAVQEAIRLSLKDMHKLNVELIDHGFDYEVSLMSGEETGDGDLDLKITVGPSCLIEVKSTQTGEVRLTPKQAETAGREKHRYVLCVVDLRAQPSETLEREWTAKDVEPLARMISNIGGPAEATWKLVDAACSSDVAIRNDKELRYGVSEALWGAGVPISQWVAAFVQAHSAMPLSSEAKAEGSWVEELLTTDE
jgi:hypothetical protein